MNFSRHCATFQLPWNTISVPHWSTYVACCHKRAPSTLFQHASHVSFLNQMCPPMLPGPLIHAKKLIGGLKRICMTAEHPKFLPPSFLWSLSKLRKPSYIYICIQMQAKLGLRAGHFAILCPFHFTHATVLLPPFKFQLTSVLLSIEHVPLWLLKAFLSPAKRGSHSPIIPWSPEQYKKLFTKVTKAHHILCATHGARHTFATIQAALNTPRPVLAQHLLHKDVKTTFIYVHELSPEELAIIAAHPEYFIPCSFKFAPAALT